MPYDSNVMRRATQALEARKAARLEQQEVLRQKIYRQLPGWRRSTGPCGRPSSTSSPPP